MHANSRLRPIRGYLHLVAHNGDSFEVPRDTAILGSVRIDPALQLVALRRRLAPGRARARSWADAAQLKCFALARDGTWRSTERPCTWPAHLTREIEQLVARLDGGDPPKGTA